MQRVHTRAGTVYYADAPNESGGDEEYFPNAKAGRKLPTFIPAWACLVAFPVAIAVVLPLAIWLGNSNHGLKVALSLGPIIMALALLWYGARTRDRNRLVFEDDGFRWRGKRFAFERIQKVRVDQRTGDHLLHAMLHVSIFVVSEGVCREVRIYAAPGTWSADHLGIELTTLVAAIAENAETDPS